MKLQYEVTNTKYLNILQVLKQELLISSKLLTKLKKEHFIFLNLVPVSVYTKIKPHDIIEISLDFIEDNSNIVPTKMDLDIVYEDEYLLILNKPAGIAIHPSCNHFNTSLSNGVKYYFDTINLSKKIRPVNRLDKDTSGLVIFAKSEYIQELLSKQMQTKDLKKEYIAILTGTLSKVYGTINAPIGRKSGSIIEREINSTGDTAITHFKLLSNLKNNLSMVSFLLETGRTHQIRVHSKYINHPILGDSLYGSKSDLISRQALHAYKITFIHPISKKVLTFETSIPNDMLKVISNVT